MRPSFRSIAASLCLLGFLAQAGDGLMAAICPPGMEGQMMTMSAGPSGADDLRMMEGAAEDSRSMTGRGHSGEVLPEGGDAPEEDPPCPFGPGPMAMCGTGATVASLHGSSFVPAEVVATRDLDTSRIPHHLLSSQLFRPPRA